MENKLSLNSNLFIVPIALLFQLLAYNGTLDAVDYTNTIKMCDELTYNTDEYNTCYKKKQTSLETKDGTIFLISMMLSVVGIVVGTIMMTMHSKLKTPGIGIGIGSVLIIIFTVVSNWNRTTEIMKLVYISICLLALIIGSIKLL